MASVSLRLPLRAALVRTHTHTVGSQQLAQTNLYSELCSAHTGRHEPKKCSLIPSSVVASDGSLINVATPQLFISVTSNLQSDMIGLMYDAVVSCSCRLHSKAKGEKNVLLSVNRNLFRCQLHFSPDLSVWRSCASEWEQAGCFKDSFHLPNSLKLIATGIAEEQIPLRCLRDCTCGSADCWSAG